MSGIVLEIPADLAEALRVPSEEIPARLRRELAVRVYEKGLLTLGKARELAGDGQMGVPYAVGRGGNRTAL